MNKQFEKLKIKCPYCHSTNIEHSVTTQDTIFIKGGTSVDYAPYIHHFFECKHCGQPFQLTGAQLNELAEKTTKPEKDKLDIIIDKLNKIIDLLTVKEEPKKKKLLNEDWYKYQPDYTNTKEVNGVAIPTYSSDQCIGSIVNKAGEE